jgi:hypothetical protein
MTILAFTAITVVIGTWLGIRAAQAHQTLQQILAAPIPTEDDE